MVAIFKYVNDDNENYSLSLSLSLFHGEESGGGVSTSDQDSSCLVLCFFLGQGSVCDVLKYLELYSPFLVQIIVDCCSEGPCPQ